MPNVASILKGEISRISRKEVKSAVGGIGKSQTNIRKNVADLKKRVASLEKEIKRLTAGKRRENTISVKEHPEGQEKARFTSKGVKSLRNRLGLSQADFAKLVGATSHAVYLWENKEGPLKLREKTKAAFLSIRGLGAREAKAKLEEAGGKPKRIKKAGS